MLYDKDENISEHHIKRCVNQLYYTSGIPARFIDGTGKITITLGEFKAETPFDQGLHLNTEIIFDEVVKSRLYNQSYTHVNTFDEHYFIFTFHNHYKIKGLIALGPIHLKDNNQSHELAFMSKYNLSISEYNQFDLYIQSQPMIAPLQEQYFNQLLNIICTYNYDLSQSPILESVYEDVSYIPSLEPNQFHHSYSLEKQLAQHMFTDNNRSLEVIAEEFSTYPRPILAINNPLRSEQNLFIATVSTYTRHAIEAGLNSEIAFSYCDHFIQEVEECTHISHVSDLLRKMVKSYKTLVRESNQSNYSNPVGLAKDYIDQHITETISLVDVADVIGYSSKYLSEIFVKETGITFKTYVNDKKMEIAKSLLLNPKNSILDVCHYLGYCNQSYFSKIFRKITGSSPSAFIKYHR